MIIDDFPSIKKALLGDSWWTPRKDSPNALQCSGENTGRAVPTCRCARCKSFSSGGSLAPITSFTILDPTH